MTHTEDPTCAVAHGTAPGGTAGTSGTGSAGTPLDRTLVAVFASPVSGFLLRYGADLGFRPLLVEPDAGRAAGSAVGSAPGGFQVLPGVPDDLDESADIVVTDHHRDELGVMLRDALAGKSRWIGVMGNPRHPAPHIPALEALGVAPGDIARVHRPIGLNIGSRRPAEIAIATLAGLIADRNGRTGGFEFSSAGG
ncbi:MAG: XdhC family protein [Streptosporangiaceae bacterium]|nr:XdhC family protein [Streptosporangiaceae bacterium]MBV9855657.1 XdhC family protein [Streptosporangiaceae bacterium]